MMTAGQKTEASRLLPLSDEGEAVQLPQPSARRAGAFREPRKLASARGLNPRFAAAHSGPRRAPSLFGKGQAGQALTAPDRAPLSTSVAGGAFN